MDTVNRLLDAKNKLFNHIIVLIISSLLTYVFWLSGVDFNRAVAGTAFTLLFLTLVIGPLMQLFRPMVKVLPWGVPWSWRGELGIWFATLSVLHFFLALSENQWQMRWSLASILGLVALFWAIILTATSFGSVIRFLGVESWRWIHTFAYVIFYLVGAHVVQHAFLRPNRPDSWMHWMYVVMMAVVVILQFTAFIKNVIHYRKNLKSS